MLVLRVDSDGDILLMVSIDICFYFNNYNNY